MTFPQDLLWGTASADFQYEGGFGEGGRGVLSHDFETDGSHTVPRRIIYKLPDGTIGSSPVKTSIPADAVGYLDPDTYYPSHKAVDFYHNFKEDIALLAEMGLTCMRFSICWSRVFPTGEETEPNQAGLDFYEAVVDECLAHNIQPLITICHDEIPAHLADKYDGWSDRKVIDFYLNYCHALFERLGKKVKYWLTFNEINVLRGYSQLGTRSASEATFYQAVHHMYIASARAIKMAHEMMPDCMMGCMYAMSPCYPATCKPDDIWAQIAARRKTMYFSDAMARGYYPAYAKTYLEKKGITLKKEPGDDELMRAYPLDFVALSCYRSTTVDAETKFGEADILTWGENPYLESTPWGWPVDPLSIRYVCNELYDRYQKPVFIVENGMGNVDVLEADGTVKDDYRIDYLKKHFQEIKKTVEEDNVPVLGYTMWGGIDLVSLSTGEMKKRYGWVYVDMDDKGNGTLKRYRKNSFYWMKEFMETNGENL